MKKIVPIGLFVTSVTLIAAAIVKPNTFFESKAYNNVSALTTTIDLNDLQADEVRDYYSSLSTLADSERTGNNLLKNLKPILKNNQTYYSYDSGSAIWQMYEITDRDWEKSPADEIAGYDETTNTITGYTYGTSTSKKGTNPYIHALYNNRDVDNLTTAWDSHGDRKNAWTIEREHIWPKSQGFEAEGKGGARGDPMHLWAANGTTNGLHSQLFYGFVDTSKKYTDSGSTHPNTTGNLTGTSLTKGTGTVFEPQDSDKGDIARAVFYMVARYNYLSGEDADGIDQDNPNLALTSEPNYKAKYTSSTTKIGELGIMEDLLAWNELDPVDDYEIHRNNLLFNNYTHNRNPFIDYPEWANLIWGDEKGVSFANPATDKVETINHVINLQNFKRSIELGSSQTITISVAENEPAEVSIEDETIASIEKYVAPVEGAVLPKYKVSINVNSGEKFVITPLKEGKTKLTIKTTYEGNPYEESYNIVVKQKTEPKQEVTLLEMLLNNKPLLIGLIIGVVIIVVIVLVFMLKSNKKQKKTVKKTVKKVIKTTKKNKKGNKK